MKGVSFIKTYLLIWTKNINMAALRSNLTVGEIKILSCDLLYKGIVVLLSAEKNYEAIAAQVTVTD
jgi:hypothetical protein